MSRLPLTTSTPLPVLPPVNCTLPGTTVICDCMFAGPTGLTGGSGGKVGGTPRLAPDRVPQLPDVQLQLYGGRSRQLNPARCCTSALVHLRPRSKAGSVRPAA